MSAVPEAVSERMRRVLEGTVECLSDGVDAKHLVQPHAWYDVNYVGWTGDKVASWRGYRANLRSLGKFRTIYINYVVNYFSFDENARLFGDDFASSIASLDDYVCIYVTACSLQSVVKIQEANFTYKKFARNNHPSCVIPITEFLLQSFSTWVDNGVKLMFLQRDHC